ncbi:uncharacterized protein BO80DRAFT_100594 [Aspergillus ibericus CBS 121593]|uniref:Uncharacterized protein n=1 Tax=Aspergillus ibericus CBS 121593 TaxID=1448316 RepID=A0A395GY67_9EURO|nr:hypothetical protein BO80DRAFT_100594 [Aspergillus ibericus CBS 121593]RAL00507.1 hypothetical protein BO80DRAFT_100594 [Aspergillus ibericus CBS 121593]
MNHALNYQPVCQSLTYPSMTGTSSNQLGTFHTYTHTYIYIHKFSYSSSSLSLFPLNRRPSSEIPGTLSVLLPSFISAIGVICCTYSFKWNDPFHVRIDNHLLLIPYLLD